MRNTETLLSLLRTWSKVSGHSAPSQLVELAGEAADLIEKQVACIAEAVKARDGWKLVPITPTESMEIAGQEAVFECHQNRAVIEDCEHARAAYAAMLRAAPEITKC